MSDPTLTVLGAVRPVLTVTQDGGVKTVRIVIPGNIGPPGPSNYQIAVQNGFVGTEAEWLASLAAEANTIAMGFADQAEASATSAAASASSAADAAQAASADSDAAASSATTAAAEALAAASSATDAAASASEALTSAQAAANSATTASTEAVEAASSAQAAQNAADSATASASTATTKAAQASDSADAASAAALSASQSALGASNSAVEADGSALAAANSATTATSQAQIATTKADEASDSAINAANSAATAQNAAESATILRTGLGAPSAGLGQDGDYYLDDADKALYGPKTAGSWGSPTSLIGPPGSGGGGGSNSFYIDASEFIPTTTAGCGIDSQETAINRVNYDILTFDPATRENAITWFAWPSGWATAKVTVFWTAVSDNRSVVLGAEMRIFCDNDAMDGAWGTAQEVVDALVTANTHRQTQATPAITPGGMVVAGCRTALRLYRNSTSGSDDLPVDALVTGVLVEKAS